MIGKDRQTRDEAFVEFVKGAQPALKQLAWLLTGDAHRAEELVQDTRVRTYGAWGRIRHDDPLAYARRVLVNSRTDGWRRRRREVLVDETPPGAVRGGHDETEGVVSRQLLVAALRRLAPRERAVLVLRYFADLSEAETASELGVSLGTVKSTASRALAKLRSAAAHDIGSSSGDRSAPPAGALQERSAR